MAPATRRHRPALAAALALAAGILADALVAPPALLWGGLCLAGLFGGLLAVSRVRPSALLVLLTVAGAGGLRHHQETRVVSRDHIRRLEVGGDPGVLAGRLIGDPTSRARGGERSTVFDIEALAWRADGADTRSLRGRVRVTLRAPALQADDGDTLLLRTRLRRAPGERNPGGFDYRAFLARQGIDALATVRPEGVLEVRGGAGAFWREHLVRPLRQAVRRALTRHLSGDVAGVLQGMLLGDRFAIPAQVQERFRHTGLAHALVISGLHVGLVALFVLTVLRLVGLPPPAAQVATTVALLLYAAAAGLQAPVVRATVMAAILLLGRAVRRRGEGGNSLGVAAVVLLAADPAALLTLSFQLSFAATAAILALCGPLERWLRERDEGGHRNVHRWLLTPLAVTLAAQTGTAPFVLWHFQQWAPLSILSNLVVVPLLGLCVCLGLLTALLGSVWTVALLPLSGATWLAMTLLLGVVDLCAAVPPLTVARPGMEALLALASLVVPAWPARHSRRWRVVWLLVALGWANIAVWSARIDDGTLRVVFLDVGQGDAAVVHLPGGGTLVVDAGEASPRYDAGERVVAPYLRRAGIGRIDAVIASHPHSDHVGGLVYLLESFEVDHYVDAGQAYDSWTSRRLRELIDEKQIAYRRVAAGDSLRFPGGVTGLVLHPTADYVTPDGRSAHGLNNGSVAFRLDYAGRRLLFTGDIEAETEPALRAWGARLRADVLKAAHHGSRTSSGEAFLDSVGASVAVVSVGAFNRFGHPATQVLQRLREDGTRARRTDLCGAVTVQIGADSTLRITSVVPDCAGG